MTKPKKEWVGWGGFLDNKLHATEEKWTDQPILAVYPTKKAANQCYEDVRKVKISLV